MYGMDYLARMEEFTYSEVKCAHVSLLCSIICSLSFVPVDFENSQPRIVDIF